MDHAPSLLPRSEKSAVRRLARKSKWNESYESLLKIKKALDEKAKQPGARVYDFRMFDLVLGNSKPTRARKEKSITPPLVQQAYNLIRSFEGKSKEFGESANIKFLSPRFAPIMPDKADIKGSLSPSIFSFYKDDTEDQLLPLPKLLDATGMTEEDRGEVLETVMEVTGARQIVDDAMKTLSSTELFGMQGEIKEVTERIAKIFTNLESTFNRRQKKDMDKRGFTFLETNQLEELHKEQGLAKHASEIEFDIHEYGNQTRAQREESLWLRVAEIAANGTKTRSKRQITWLSVNKPTVLSPYMFSPVYGLVVLGPCIRATSKDAVHEHEKLILDKKGLQNMKEVHKNWYFYSIKALLGQLGKELLGKLNSASRERLKLCLKRIVYTKDLRKTAACLLKARERWKKFLKYKGVKEDDDFPSKALHRGHDRIPSRFSHALRIRKLRMRRSKRSPNRLILPDDLKDHELVVKSAKFAPSLKEPSKSPINKVAGLFVSLFGKSSANELPEKWSTTYKSILKLSKYIDKNENSPGTRVYNTRIYDLVMDAKGTKQGSEIGKAFEQLQSSLSLRQSSELDKRGFTFMNPKQIDKLHEKQNVSEPEVLEQMESYKKLPKHKREEMLWRSIGELAGLSRRRRKRQANQINFITTLRPTVLSPYQFAPVYGISILGPVILSPNIFAPLILNPSLFSPWVLSPAFPLPFILSPYVLTPYVLSPLAMAPFVFSPYVLSPNVINPYVLSPVILSPIVVCPDILSPMTLGGIILSPNILSPSILSKSYLMTSVLSPSLLS
ncbi:unnamed protein product [Cylicocyclus nassatus]|uniref:Uncharacterized protein n=1 Tax=Cylicocyclus nassatus TaxID=53992 RepID=A0AA36H7C3_CYLNA|nr:unnamed protein product [Cylicocyclus nassatus]